MSRLLLAALAAAPPSTDATEPVVVVTHSGADASLPPWGPDAALIEEVRIEAERIAGPKPRNRHERRAADARARSCRHARR